MLERENSNGGAHFPEAAADAVREASNSPSEETHRGRIVSIIIAVALALPAAPVIGSAGPDRVAKSGLQTLPPAGQQAAIAETISPAGGDANEPQVAIDGKGNALVVWGRSDGFHTRIQVRRRFASGSLSPVQTLSAARGRRLSAAGRARSERQCAGGVDPLQREQQRHPTAPPRGLRRPWPGADHLGPRD